MTACVDCGADHHTGHYLADDNQPRCLACHNRHTGKRCPRVSSYISPDDYYDNREAFDHAEARHRRRVIDNEVNNGNRNERVQL